MPLTPTAQRWSHANPHMAVPARRRAEAGGNGVFEEGQVEADGHELWREQHLCQPPARLARTNTTTTSTVMQLQPAGSCRSGGSGAGGVAVRPAASTAIAASERDRRRWARRRVRVVAAAVAATEAAAHRLVRSDALGEKCLCKRRVSQVLVTPPELHRRACTPPAGRLQSV